jgi:LysR family cyn operon transcriptional activator
VEFRTLQYFISVAELLSFSAAADRLSVSQSAVSRQVQLLEQELGVRLFDRVGRKVFLNPAGRDLLEHSYEVQKAVVALGSRAAELSGVRHGALRVGATPQTLESVLARFLPRFSRTYPELRIELVEDGSANLARAVENGRIDVAIGALDPNEGLESAPLFPLVVLVALPRGHRLHMRKRVDVEELAEERLLLLREGFMTRRIFDGACHVAHLAARVVLESGSAHCLLSLVNSGLGVAVIPSTVRLSRGHPRVVPLAQSGRTLGMWMQAMWDPRRYTSAAAQGFIAALTDETRIDYPGKSFAAGLLPERTLRKAALR